jgi:hypothetical protein
MRSIGLENIVDIKFSEVLINTGNQDNGYDTRKESMSVFARNLCRNDQDLIEKLFYLQR